VVSLPEVFHSIAQWKWTIMSAGPGSLPHRKDPVFLSWEVFRLPPCLRTFRPGHEALFSAFYRNHPGPPSSWLLPEWRGAICPCISFRGSGQLRGSAWVRASPTFTAPADILLRCFEMGVRRPVGRRNLLGSAQSAIKRWPCLIDWKRATSPISSTQVPR